MFNNHIRKPAKIENGEVPQNRARKNYYYNQIVL